jgi:hypothetical protein
VQQDIKKVFMNNDEFSGIHIINEKETSVIVDDLELTEREKKQKYDTVLSKKEKLIYVNAEEYGPLPRINTPLILDGKTYLIKEASEEDGIYSLHLEANKS